MEPPTPKEIERPDWVWFLLIVYCIGVVISFAAILIVAILPGGHIDPIALGISLVVMALRGVGFVRLFYFKKDAWIYLAFALFILVASNALDLLLGGRDFFVERHPVVQTFVGYAVGAAVIVYAFRIGNNQAKT